MKREIRYDLLRITACFAVVLLHVSNGHWYVVDINSTDFTVMTIYNSFTRFGVPVFFMLSGLFLLDPQKELSLKKWGTRIGKLIVGFFVWSLFYAFQSVIYNGVLSGWDSVTGEMWSSALVRLIRGHGHMWFLMDLLGFYLLLPILRKICEDIRLTGYFLLLWVVVRFFVNTVLPYLGGEMIIAVVSSMHLYLFTGFIGYFLGGYFLQKVDIPKWCRGVLYVLGAGSIVFTILKTLQDCRATQSYDDRWFSPSNINVLLLSIATFVFFKYAAVPSRFTRAKWVPVMAGCTFFVYMVHPFLLEKLGLVGIKVTAYPVVLSIPIMTIGIFAVGMLAGWIVGKIPVIGKWITFQ